MCKKEEISNPILTFYNSLNDFENIYNNNSFRLYDISVRMKENPLKEKIQKKSVSEYISLVKEINNCKKCNLHLSRNNPVVGDGLLDADIMLIGESPGPIEDKTGKPFSGKSGKILDNVLLQNSVDRKKIYITNIVKCRSPNNRNPELKEQMICSKYLLEQINLIKPKLILTLGLIASKFILKTDMPMYKIRSNFIKLNGFKDEIIMMPTYHPSAILQNENLYPKFKMDINKFIIMAKRLNCNF